MTMALTQTNRQLLFLFFSTFALFTASNWDGGWVFDDHAQVETNPYIRSIDNVPKILTTRLWRVTGADSEGSQIYRPVFMLSYLIDYQIAGLRTWWMHIHNNALHAINVVLLYLLLIQFCASSVALFFGFIFAFHPMVIEAVTWIGGRMDILVTLFALIFTHLTIRLQQRRVNKHTWFWAGLGLVFILGFFSKEVFTLLPFLVVTSLIVTSEDRILRPPRWSIYLMIFLVLGTGLGILWRQTVIKEGILELLDPVIFPNFLALLRRFIWLFLNPVDSEFLLPYENIRFDPMAHIFPMIGCFLILVWLLYRHRREPLLWLGFSFLLAPLIPISLVLDMAHLMSERYFYFPLVGLLLILAYYASKYLVHINGPKIRQVSKAFMFIWIGLLAALTIARNREWRSELTLFEASIRRDPSNYRPYFALAWLYKEKGDRIQEMEFYSKTLERNPNHVQSLVNVAVRLIEQRKLREAFPFLERALTIQPNRANTHYNLGYYFEITGDVSKALDHYRKSVELNPSYSKAKNALDRITRVKR